MSRDGTAPASDLRRRLPWPDFASPAVQRAEPVPQCAEWCHVKRWPIGLGGYMNGLDHITKFCGFGKTRIAQGTQVHVHAVGQELVAAGVRGNGADKWGWRTGLESLINGEKLLVRGQTQIRRERVKPVFRAVDLHQGLHPLAAPRKIVVVIIGVLPVGQAPLAQIVRTLGIPGFVLGPAERGQEQACEHRDDPEHSTLYHGKAA